MINRKKILAVITARGGSKGVHRKNIRIVAKKPLIAWTIEAARKSIFIDRLIVSTDDLEIAEVAKQFGAEVPFLRPKELASDESSGISPVIHAIENVDATYDYVLLLQPTSPLRTSDDIDNAIKLFFEKGTDSCVSVSESNKHPNLMYQISTDLSLIPVFASNDKHLRRQDLTKVFSVNGAIYIAKRDFLMTEKKFIDNETLAFIMPPERSLDIDSEFDLLIADLLITHKIGGTKSL